MNDIIIKADNVHFSYEDGSKALNGVNLSIQRGQKVVLMGANGSGKSTFFLCLNGIHKPQSGTMSYDGRPYSYNRKGLLELRSKIGIVFQEPDNQLFSASVYQEISFGILNLGVTKEAAAKEVENVIAQLEITPFRHKPTHALSGGQKKQVSIADILVMNPDVIIFDEPAAALDPKHSAIVNRLINKLSASGITVIISTHDVNFALEWADHVVLFKDGMVLSQGNPQEIFLDSELLPKANLETPTVIEIFKSLCERGILGPSLPLPRSTKTLQKYIDEFIH